MRKLFPGDGDENEITATMIFHLWREWKAGTNCHRVYGNCCHNGTMYVWMVSNAWCGMRDTKECYNSFHRLSTFALTFINHSQRTWWAWAAYSISWFRSVYIRARIWLIFAIFEQSKRTFSFRCVQWWRKECALKLCHRWHAQRRIARMRMSLFVEWANLLLSLFIRTTN